MIFFLFKEFLTFFNKFVPSGVSLTNRCLLVLDGHDNYVTLNAIEHAQEFGLNMITLLSQTSHALHPLNVSCFKPFKTTLKKVRDVVVSKNNHKQPNKIILARWVDQSINQNLTKKNIKFGFKVIFEGHPTNRLKINQQYYVNML
jgi:hypothetical protein